MNLIKVIYPWHALSQEIIGLKQPTTQADHGLNALVRIIANMLCLREGRWGNISKEAVRVYGKLLRCVVCSAATFGKHSPHSGAVRLHKAVLNLIGTGCGPGKKNE